MYLNLSSSLIDKRYKNYHMGFFISALLSPLKKIT